MQTYGTLFFVTLVLCFVIIVRAVTGFTPRDSRCGCCSSAPLACSKGCASNIHLFTWINSASFFGFSLSFVIDLIQLHNLADSFGSSSIYCWFGGRSRLSYVTQEKTFWFCDLKFSCINNFSIVAIQTWDSRLRYFANFFAFCNHVHSICNCRRCKCIQPY